MTVVRSDTREAILSSSLGFPCSDQPDVQDLVSHSENDVPRRLRRGGQKNRKAQSYSRSIGGNKNLCSMPDETSPSKSSQVLQNAVNSQPFVPAARQNPGSKPLNDGGFKSRSTNVDAKPFVPSASNAQSPGGRKISANAAPYVPAQPSPARQATNQQYQRTMPNKSPEASRSRGRGMPRSDSRFSVDGSEYSGMGSPYAAVPMNGRLPNGAVPMAEPAYGMRQPYPQAYVVHRVAPVVPVSPRLAVRPVVLHPQQRPPPDLNNRNMRGRGRPVGLSSPGQAPLFFAGQVAVTNSLPVLARVHQNAAMASDQLMAHLQTRAYLTQAQMLPEAQAEFGLPDMVAHYHSLKTLEEPKGKAEVVSKSLGVSSLVFKGISINDGAALAVRRISWMQLPPSGELQAHADEVIEAWKPIALHPHLSVPKTTFVALDTAERPMLHVGHCYHPGAATLEATHLQPQVTANGLVQMTATEEMVWSYLLQIVAGMGAVHAVGLACRAALHPSKVLLLPGGRIRLGSLGVAEMIAGLSARHDDVAFLQQEDLRALGGLLLQLLCGSSTHASLDQVSAHSSPELTHVVASLTGHSEPLTSWHQLAALLRDRAFTELDMRAAYSDAVTVHLAQEVENGRLMRLMVKLVSVLERADMEPQWTETGDRYLLKLFRDFVFHQNAEDGTPLMDWSHTVEALNKLDAGVPEKLILMSRDEASMLVVTYADIKRCLEGALNDLRRRAPQLPTPF